MLIYAKLQKNTILSFEIFHMFIFIVTYLFLYLYIFIYKRITLVLI